MKVLNQLRYSLSRYFLDTSPQSNRRVKVNNYAESRSIGIIYKEKDESFYILVKQFVKYLKAEHGIREVLAMAYIENKQIPHWQMHKLEFDYFSVADTDWRLKPNTTNVDDFIAKDFDILIDLTLETHPSLMHILGRSRARFKVGAWNPAKKEQLDFMVDLSENNTFDQYVNKLNHFLTVLNKQKNAEAV